MSESFEFKAYTHNHQKIELDNGNTLDFNAPQSDFSEGEQFHVDRQRDLVAGSNLLGSTIDLDDCMFDPKFKKLSRINRISSYDKNDKRKTFRSRKNYLINKYSFLNNFIPSKLFNEIIQLIAYGKIKRKRISRSHSLNLDTITMFLAFWQLELYTRNSYLSDGILRDINKFLSDLIPYHNRANYITMKDIVIHEDKIIKDLYSYMVLGQEGEYFSKFPRESMTYYSDYIFNFLDQWESLIPSRIRKAIVKLHYTEADRNQYFRQSLLTRTLRVHIVRQMMPYFNHKFGFNLEINLVHKYTDRFFVNMDFNSYQMGTISTVGVSILVAITKALGKPQPSIALSGESSKSFLLRLKKYGEKIGHFHDKSNIRVFNEIPESESAIVVQDRKVVEPVPSLNNFSLEKIQCEINDLATWFTRLRQEIKNNNILQKSERIRKEFPLKVENLKILLNLETKVKQHRINIVVQEKLDQFQARTLEAQTAVLDTFEISPFDEVADHVETFKLDVVYDQKLTLKEINGVLAGNTELSAKFNTQLTIIAEECIALLEDRLEAISAITFETQISAFEDWSVILKRKYIPIIQNNYSDDAIGQTTEKIMAFKVEIDMKYEDVTLEIDNLDTEPSIISDGLEALTVLYQNMVKVYKTMLNQNEDRFVKLEDSFLTTPTSNLEALSELDVTKLDSDDTNRFMNLISETRSIFDNIVSAVPAM